MPIRLGAQASMGQCFADEVRAIRERVARIQTDKAHELRKRIGQLEITPAWATEYWRSDQSWQRAQVRKQLLSCQAVIDRLKEPKESDLTSATRGGLEYELLRLKRLPYVGYTVRRRTSPRGNHQTWLIAETRVIETHDGQRPCWAGPYYVCVEAGSFGTSTMSWHLVPKEYPGNPHRHMHHTCWGNPEYSNPLDADPRTCWGQFTGIIQNVVLDGDIAGAFEILHRFAGALKINDALDHYPAAVRYENPRTS